MKDKPGKPRRSAVVGEGVASGELDTLRRHGVYLPSVSSRQAGAALVGRLLHVVFLEIAPGAARVEVP